MSQEIANEIKIVLERALGAEVLAVIDESHLHAGHRGAEPGKGHYKLKVRGVCFDGLPLIRQHRLIYDALGTLMRDKIHALSIQIVKNS